MTPDSEFHEINGLNYHVQRWGSAAGHMVFLLHGWGDCGLSFQFLAEQLLEHAEVDLDIIAPDWRGFGRSDHAAAAYWFPDYYADLEALLDIYSAEEPVTLVGHSMGGHVACMYAGIRPARVGQLVAIDGLGMPPIDSDEAPGRFATWLDELKQEPSFSRYAGLDVMADLLAARSSNIDLERANFVARAWMRHDQEQGDFVLRADPRHKRVNPVLYRHEEVMACWRRITARMLAVIGGDSSFLGRYEESGVLEQLAGMVDDLESAVIADSGHMVHHEQPEDLAAAIIGWLET